MTGRELYERWCGRRSNDSGSYVPNIVSVGSGSRSIFNARLKMQSLLRWRDERRFAMATDAVRETIHRWFGLSYANYLVLPRSVLQSMPDEWQHRFVAALEEMSEAFGNLDWPSYDVRVLKCEPEEVVPEAPCEVCDRTGVGADDEDCAACGGLGDIENYAGRRCETPDEVGFREDPIPHYNRGRTRIVLG